MRITIDTEAGFCPGVKKAIRKAEEEMEKNGELYSLGSLLHNELEMGRLSGNGLILKKRKDLPGLQDKKVLIRAHGEPPQTFTEAKDHSIALIDATCGVVKRLQQKIKKAAEEMRAVEGQVVIFGRQDHPEVIGLMGHTNSLGIVISSPEDLSKVNPARAVRLFSQTTMDADLYEHIYRLLNNRMNDASLMSDLVKYDTICLHVSKRIPALRAFAAKFELLIFVSGKESSNGKKLFSICKEVNPCSHFIESGDELQKEWFSGVSSIGISGAASTPGWLMEDVAEKIKQLN